MKWIIGCAVVLFGAAVARAELKPSEVAVIAMAESPESRALAEYYAEARGIPKSQILLLEGGPSEEMSRAVWQEQVQPAVRAWLAEDDRTAKIRCVVTCRDVPLRIGRRDPNSPVVVARQAYLTETRAKLVAELADLAKKMDSVFLGDEAPERPSLEAEAEVSVLAGAMEEVFKAAAERLNAAETDDERNRLAAALERGLVAGSGIAGLLDRVTRVNDPTDIKPEVAQQLAGRRGQLLGLQEGLKAMASLPDSVARDTQTLRLVQAAAGAFGSIRWIDEQRELLRKNETYSSFDSELAVIRWPDYPLFSWLPNALNYHFDTVNAPRLETLMVARLDAPTFELARGLVDAAIATEKTGLTGKVYLDARGMKYDPKNDEPGSYASYDQSLRDLAERLREHTKLEVVLDDEAGLFQEGQCPDAALYCGWYSLAKYIDAFDWQPGSVGYHLASSEATTLRTPGSKVWCNAMLEDGIGATLGPVFEPYLAAFPLPDDFFPLLLTGRYTLVEAYYRTLPYNSWAMVLVGDPLYNPFKANPALGEDGLPDRLKGSPAETPAAEE